MKLAEALALRADAQKRLEQLKERATSSARYQEGEEPAENAGELLAQARSVAGEIERFVRAVNRTNAATELDPGFTITDALAHREALAAERAAVAAVADAAQGRSRYGMSGRQLRSELRWITDLEVGDLRAEADRLARDRRGLETRIQEANWTTELIDEPDAG
ncbi:hypothetical protein GON03_05565 [Nocardioides sp. MAH-18]|uniref:DIP1984 family protein n=1 Tax=Nocardioides agri TaxID=2682843 RepID=A0A6L6XMW1_9ACTN|nr:MULTISPECIES: DIP1984 family protein [unclassified Nocardioides]MBA2953776.1 DIP1984 family protein [Nocardioides sp. CGMCC 1.13656]MVQ48641.1 hypothetical protein [Nocardioides sp. MAH-18]